MVSVTVLDKSAAASLATVTKAAKKISALVGKEDAVVEIFLVDSKRINKNVLSFPADTTFPRPDLKQQTLGEIYLNPSYIEQHNEDLVYMLVHGFLHLLGYDHIKARDRMKMEKKEQELLKKLGSTHTV